MTVAGRAVQAADAEGLLASGGADFVSVGPALYADPHWCLKAFGEVRAPFQQRTGRHQVAFAGGQGVPAHRLGQLEPFEARFPSAAGRALPGRRRPVVETGLGGNLPLLYRGRGR